MKRGRGGNDAQRRSQNTIPPLGEIDRCDALPTAQINAPELGGRSTQRLRKVAEMRAPDVPRPAQDLRKPTHAMRTIRTDSARVRESRMRTIRTIRTHSARVRDGLAPLPPMAAETGNSRTRARVVKRGPRTSLPPPPAEASNNRPWRNQRYTGGGNKPCL